MDYILKRKLLFQEIWPSLINLGCNYVFPPLRYNKYSQNHDQVMTTFIPHILFIIRNVKRSYKRLLVTVNASAFIGLHIQYVIDFSIWHSKITIEPKHHLVALWVEGKHCKAKDCPIISIQNQCICLESEC